MSLNQSPPSFRTQNPMTLTTTDQRLNGVNYPSGAIYIWIRLSDNDLILVGFLVEVLASGSSRIRANPIATSEFVTITPSTPTTISQAFTLVTLSSSDPNIVIEFVGFDSLNFNVGVKTTVATIPNADFTVISF